MALIFVDCEGKGPAPGLNNDAKFEFGAVEYRTRESFHGYGGTEQTFRNFAGWLLEFTHPCKKCKGQGYLPDGDCPSCRGLGRSRLTFVSDNVAYDWQFINYYLHKFTGSNPFGHSGRRIGDFFAGLKGDFYAAQDWKKWRKTPHDHNPVHDAMGNVEAFERIMATHVGARYAERLAAE